jgi:SAM-dependent methyltransferase
MSEWWESFFDADYIDIWERAIPPGKTEREADGLWSLLNLSAESRILDAPCGYGRLSRILAERCGSVLGVDRSAELLAAAESRRGNLPVERLRYQHRDLRDGLAESHFDAAINIFSSLGYGTEGDDISVLSTLRDAVRPGGLVFVETYHRDSLVVALSRTQRPAQRLPDGTLLLEEPQFDPVEGRVQTTWYWSGSRGSGQKRASIRVYTATELTSLLRSVGLVVRSVHNGCSMEPFVFTGALNRLGVLASRD